MLRNINCEFFGRLLRWGLSCLLFAALTGTGFAEPQDQEFVKALQIYEADKTEASLYAMKALGETGNRNAQGFLAQILWSGPKQLVNQLFAAKWAKLAADQGDSAGQNVLANMYRQGFDVPKDPKEAIRLYQLSWAQGYNRAAANIADIHYKGDGVPKNPTEGFKWLKLAAESGHQPSIIRLAYVYRTGDGTPKTDDEALRLLMPLATQGDAAAMAELADGYRRTFDKKDFSRSFEWASKSAEKGHRAGQEILGQLYLNGQGVPRDFSKAITSFRLSAAQNSPWAQNALGRVYENGWGVQQSYEEAARWYMKAAAQGNEDAKKNLGATYAMRLAGERVKAESGPLAAEQKPANDGASREQLRLLDEAWRKAEADAQAHEKEQVKRTEEARLRTESENRAREQERVLSEAKAREQARLVDEARAKDEERRQAEARAQQQLKLAEEARIKAESEARAKEQERVLAENKAKEQARLIAEARAKDDQRRSEEERLRVQSEARTKEQERILAENKAKDAELVALRSQLEKMKQQASQASAVVQLAKRKALVIGNDSYKSIQKLDNAVADANAMAENLSKVGYGVTLKANLTEKEMKIALRTFKSQVEPGDEVAIFYAGHGIQLDNTNYLIPIDVAGDSPDQIKDDAIPLQRVLDDMSERKAKLTLALIDACRDNPFKTGGRSVGQGRGLAPTTAATGQMVVFSAGSGQQALDKLGPTDREKNGLFTRVFIREMTKPDRTVDAVVRQVRNEVVRLAKTVAHEQVPAIYDQVVGEFYFSRSGQ